MTQQPRATGPGDTGPGRGGSAARERADGTGAERIVIRDRRRIDPTDKVKPAKGEQGEDLAAGAETVEAAQAASTGGAAEAAAAAATASATASSAAPASAVGDVDGGGVKDEADTKPDDTEPDDTEPDDIQPDDIQPDDIQPDDIRPDDIKPDDIKPDDKAATPAKPAGDRALGAELESLRSALEERTRDLQRVSAEYANYRKRVDRDRGLAAEQTTGTVIGALLPVLDDLDRAREHGDLVGPFGSVAEQLVTSLGKFGLTAFGEKGDPFDPKRHEAVAHLTSADVTEPTCIDVMRRGYLLGDRLLRPALVAVADPE
ncbi:MAG TPA: nucleotide exchange factor GrpE [Asanoa sp.]